jgi:hypothetical protein
MIKMFENDTGVLKELKFLETGYDLIQVDYDIQNVLGFVSRENLKDVVGNVTGCVVKLDNTGTEFKEIWATDSTFPFSLNSIYEKIK